MRPLRVIDDLILIDQIRLGVVCLIGPQCLFNCLLSGLWGSVMNAFNPCDARVAHWTGPAL